MDASAISITTEKTMNPVKQLTCPLENKVRQRLTDAGIAFIEEEHNDCQLDFYLPTYGVYIEVKSGHTPRSDKQLQRAPNIIMIQGSQSVDLFCDMLEGVRI